MLGNGHRIQKRVTTREKGSSGWCGVTSYINSWELESSDFDIFFYFGHNNPRIWKSEEKKYKLHPWLAKSFGKNQDIFFGIL
jgi:hypothetical protein